jgi:tetratricopeptide (TPR) repeat protein
MANTVREALSAQFPIKMIGTCDVMARPTLTPERWRQIEQILIAAWETAPETRDAYLCDRCGTDSDLLWEVRSLSAARAAADQWRSPEPPPPTIIGHRLGPYELERLLCRGGLGAVYLAHRADGEFDQLVAIKLIGLPFELEAFRERFRRERQILAGLNHPNITRLLDGGVTDDGQLYLVMEYVDGVPIDRFPADPVGKLDLFLGVCAAVQYAHQHLVVHRDIKPSNILVDATGTPKLLDFGAAKLLAGAEVTRTGFGMMTTAYASPEQLRGEQASTLSDVFSLGAVLYELIAGEKAFGDDLVSRLRDEESGGVELPKPLPGDLDRVVRRALAWTPSERYSSAGQLAEDIRRYSDGEPVLAHPPSFRYRAGKFLRRRWLPLAAVAVFIVALSAATIVAVEQTRAARSEASRAQKVSRFLGEMMASGSSRGGKDFTVAQMLDAFEPEVGKSFKDDPLTEASLRMNLGASYTSLQLPERATGELEKAMALYHSRGDLKGEVVVLWILGQNAEIYSRPGSAAHFYEQAMERLRGLGMKAAPVWAFRVRRDFAGTLIESAVRRLPEARVLLDEAIDLGHREASIPRGDVLEAEARVGWVLAEQGRDQEAEASLDHTLLTWRRDYPGEECTTELLARIAMSARRQDFAAARDFARRRFEAMVQLHGPNHIITMLASLDWARFRAETGETVEAMAQVRTALAEFFKYASPGSESLCFPLAARSQVLVKAGEYKDAERDAREALKGIEAAHREEIDPFRAEVLEHLGAALSGQKRYREAIPVLEKAEAIYRQSGPAWLLTADRTLRLRNQAQAVMKGR